MDNLDMMGGNIKVINKVVLPKLVERLTIEGINVECVTKADIQVDAAAILTEKLHISIALDGSYNLVEKLPDGKMKFIDCHGIEDLIRRLKGDVAQAESA